MTDDLPDEWDNEREETEPDTSVGDAATTGEAASSRESQAVEPALTPAAENAAELPSDPFSQRLPIPELDREANSPLPREAQMAASDDPRRVLDNALADQPLRAAEAAVPSVGDQPPIEHGFLQREDSGRDRLEVGVQRHGEMGEAVKLSESSQQQSTSLTGTVPPPTPTLPVSAGREELFRAPHVMVLVQLAETRAMYLDAIGEALDQKAPKYREIAESEVKLGFWRYENQRRAADYRLRGPSW